MRIPGQGKGPCRVREALGGDLHVLEVMQG